MNEIKQEQPIKEIQEPITLPIENVIATNTKLEEQMTTLLTTVSTLIEKVDKPTPTAPKLTSITKRLITSGIFLVGVIVAAGWAFGDVTAANALIVISSINTGGFALLRL